MPPPQNANRQEQHVVASPNPTVDDGKATADGPGKVTATKAEPAAATTAAPMKKTTRPKRKRTRPRTD